MKQLFHKDMIVNLINYYKTKFYQKKIIEFYNKQIFDIY